MLSPPKSLCLAMAVATLVTLSANARSWWNDAKTRHEKPARPWPSLEFHFELKRSSIAIYGQSDFSMIAHPTVSDDDTTVLYDVFATFITASKFDEIVETNYTLRDGCASLTTTSTDAFGNRASHVMCLDSEADELPSVNTIVDALNKATLVSSSTSSRVATECSNGLFNVSVNGISFALCASDATDFTLRGSDMDISVVQRDKVEVPVKTAFDHRCGRVVSHSTLTPTGRAFLTGQRPISKTRRHLKQTFHFWHDHESSNASASDVSCNSKELDAAYRAAQEVYRDNIAALMCSDGFSGLPSKYRAKFWALGELIPFKSDGKNDGVVPFTSCAAGIPDSKFHATWKSPFYKSKLNHFDSAFLNGDSDDDERKMPIKWFECLL
ncbi:hypothetical protein PsorP6_012460 [Peronosclerospora sorghi]|uniref:Uncharacterized protein n=1 Tax=Peronosclerospora sorghi TaxID=230839 RepID=A0ACC0WGR7_9STRA|nr:hypothetical protein PsorP6_012460 [Peronosclerospora sorghi]